MTIELLVDDYERKLKTVDKDIKENKYILEVQQGNTRQLFEKQKRLETKRECYKSFLAELQRVA